MSERITQSCIEQALASMEEVEKHLDTALYQKRRDGTTARQLHYVLVAAQKLRKRIKRELKEEDKGAQG